MPQLAAGPSPVVRPWTKTPSMAIMARAAVLDLLNLEHGEIVGGRGDVEEVEGTAGVDGVEAGEVGAGELALEGDETVRRRSLARAVALDGGKEANLDGGEEVGVLENLGAASLAVEEDLAGLGPDAAGDAEGLGDHDAGDGEHRPPGVDHLGGAVLLNLAVLAELEGVEAVVTREGAVEVGGNIGVDVEETGGEVQAAVGAWIAREGRAGWSEIIIVIFACRSLEKTGCDRNFVVTRLASLRA